VIEKNTGYQYKNNGLLKPYDFWVISRMHKVLEKNN